MTVPSGATAILIACPSSKTGVTKILNTTVNADMTSSFNKYNNIQVYNKYKLLIESLLLY